MRFFKGNAFSVEAPNFVTLEVTDTEPGFKGDTASNTYKPATVAVSYTHLDVYKRQMLCNTVGVIDSDYYYAQNQGHILVKIFNGGEHPVTLACGERFCQGIFLPYGLAQEEPVSTQRSGGLGSTGT